MPRCVQKQKKKRRKRRKKNALTLPAPTRSIWHLVLYVFASECYGDLANGAEAIARAPWLRVFEGIVPAVCSPRTKIVSCGEKNTS